MCWSTGNIVSHKEWRESQRVASEPLCHRYPPIPPQITLRDGQSAAAVDGELRTRAREGDPSDLLWEEEEHLGEDPKVVVTPVHVDFTLDNLGAHDATDVSF